MVRRYWLPAGFVLLPMAWIIFATLVAPPMIDEASRNGSLPALLRLLTGAAEPTANTRAAWNALAWKVFVVWSLGALLALGVFVKRARELVEFRTWSIVCITGMWLVVVAALYLRTGAFDPWFLESTYYLAFALIFSGL